MKTLRPMQECERRYTAYGGSTESPEPLTVIQNTEIGDHYRVELFLERWRTAAELVMYLQWAAEQVLTLEKQRQRKRE